MAIDLDAIADLGDAADLLDDVARHGLIGPRFDFDSQQLVEHVYAIEAAETDPATGLPLDSGWLLLELVLQLADDLFEHVLKRDDAVRATVVGGQN